MTTIRYNTETGDYTRHSEPYRTMDGNAGRIDPPWVQLEVVTIELPQHNPLLERLTMKYEFQVNPEPHDLCGINGTATEIWTIEYISDYEIAMRDWLHPEYAMRIVAPAEMILEDIGIKMYGWFQFNNLPVEKVNGNVHLYCNVILPSHQAIIDGLEGIITIEERPDPNSYLDSGFSEEYPPEE